MGEIAHCGLRNFAPERRQGIQDSLAIALGDQAAVEQGDGAPVLFGTQQATTGLDQFQRGIRHRDFHERIASAGFDPFGQCGLDRIVRHRERDFGDHHVFAVSPGQVDTFGETRQAEQHTGVPTIDPRLVLVQGFLFRQVALDKHLLAPVAVKAVEHVLHLFA